MQFFCDFLQNFATFSKNQLDSFVDLEKPEKMRIWSQNFVSIQPRTSLEKSDVSRSLRGKRRCSRASTRTAQPVVRSRTRWSSNSRRSWKKFCSRIATSLYVHLQTSDHLDPSSRLITNAVFSQGMGTHFMKGGTSCRRNFSNALSG